MGFPVVDGPTGVAQTLGEMPEEAGDQGERSLAGISGAEAIYQRGDSLVGHAGEFRGLDDVDPKTDGGQESGPVTGMDQNSPEFVSLDKNIVGPLDAGVVHTNFAHGLVYGGGRQNRQVGYVGGVGHCPYEVEVEPARLG